MKRKNHTILLFNIFMVLTISVRKTVSENFEFHLSNAMIITSLRVYEKNADASLFVAKPKNGSIILKADPGHGIMAVVQTMNLQDIQDPPGCLDSIQMSQIEGSLKTEEICGHSESYHHQRGEMNQALDDRKPTFLDPSGFLEMDFEIKEKSRLSPWDGINMTNFNVTFTPFRECPEDAFPFGNEALRPCSLLQTFSCIDAHFFCDGVINCAFPQEFGLDEQNCPGPEDEENNELQINTNADNDDDGNVQQKSSEDQGVGGVEVIRRGTDEKELNLVHFLIWKHTRRTYAGLFATVTIFALLLGLIKMSRRRGSTILIQQQEAPAESSKMKSSFHSSEIYCHYEDPAPSYEDCCLLVPESTDMRPVYSALSIELEKPPSYEEVRIHSWNKRSNSINALI